MSDSFDFLNEILPFLRDSRKALIRRQCPTRDTDDRKLHKLQKSRSVALLDILMVLADETLSRIHELDATEDQSRQKASAKRRQLGAQRRGEAKSRQRGIRPEVEINFEDGNKVGVQPMSGAPKSEEPKSMPTPADHAVPEEENPNDSDPGEHAIMIGIAELAEQGEDMSSDAPAIDPATDGSWDDVVNKMMNDPSGGYSVDWDEIPHRSAANWTNESDTSEGHSSAMAEQVAVRAILPGGVNAFGQHFEAKPPG